MPLTITQDVYRRFIMGMQGLWPGRRWQGRGGAVCQTEHATRRAGWAITVSSARF